VAKKIFFKHLRTSIRRRPFQPFLLTLVIAFAVASCIAILNIQDGIRSELRYTNDLQIGTCDYRVDANVVSEKRFFLVDEARESLSDLADVCGILGMPLVTEDDVVVTGCFTEFSEVGKIFPLYLTDTVRITEEELASSCLLSKNAADSLHLTVGDTLTVSVLGKEKRLTVFGIAQYDFLDAYGVLMDCSVFLSALSDNSCYLSLIAYQFPLSNSLFVKAKENVDTEFLGTKLQELYPDSTVEPRANIEVYMFASSKMFVLMVLITVLFVGLVIYCCCNILSVQRQEETSLLQCVGSPTVFLALISAAEMALYAFVGGGIGYLLSLPVDTILLRSCDLSHITPSSHVGNAVLSVGLIFCASECSLCLQLVTAALQKKRYRTKKKVKKERSFLSVICIVLFSLYIVCLLITVNVKDVDKWYSGLGMVLFIFLFLFFFGKQAARFFPTFFLKFTKKPSSAYAFKNIRHIPTLKNTMGITTLFFTVMFIIVFLLVACTRGTSFFREYLHTDYIVMDSSVSDESLAETDGIADVYHVLSEDVPYEDWLLTLTAADSADVFGERTEITDLPSDDHAFIGKTIADHFCLQEGEYFTVQIGDRSLNLYYEKSIPINGRIVIIDAEYWGIPYSYRTVIGQEGYDEKQIYDNLMTTLSGNIAYVIKSANVMDAILGANRYYVPCGTFVLIVISIFSVIGIGNNIASSYRSRREEFYSYSIAGMSQSELKKMKGKEIAYTFLIGFTIFLIFVSLAVLAVYYTGLGFLLNIMFSLK